jgi:hypothetical protein
MSPQKLLLRRNRHRRQVWDGAAAVRPVLSDPNLAGRPELTILFTFVHLSEAKQVMSCAGLVLRSGSLTNYRVALGSSATVIQKRSIVSTMAAKASVVPGFVTYPFA